MEEMNKLLAKRWVSGCPRTCQDASALSIKGQSLPSPRTHCHQGTALQGPTNQVFHSRGVSQAASRRHPLSSNSIFISV